MISLLSKSERDQMFTEMNDHFFLKYLIAQALMGWPVLSIPDIMWTLHPTHCALRPVEFQTENKCDIIGLNDRGPRWYYSGSTASPCYLLFISFASSVHVSVLFVCESLSPLPKTCLMFLAVIRFASLVCKNHQPQSLDSWQNKWDCVDWICYWVRSIHTACDSPASELLGTNDLTENLDEQTENKRICYFPS